MYKHSITHRSWTMTPKGHVWPWWALEYDYYNKWIFTHSSHSKGRKTDFLLPENWFVMTQNA